jgi:predicted phosphodiesterase
MKKLLLLFSLFCLASVTDAQIEPIPEIDWEFQPDYQLKGNAANKVGPVKSPPQSRFARFKSMGLPLIYFGQHPTERKTDLIAPVKLPSGNFSIEMWLINHVNMPVGLQLSARSKSKPEEITWLLGCFDKEIVAHFGNETFSIISKKGWKKYWGHLVMTVDAGRVTLYLNGEKMLEETVSENSAYAPDVIAELAGYFQQEPGMEISNLLKRLRLYHHALNQQEVASNFLQLQHLVEKGALFSEGFHFNAGPYLHFARPESISLTVETNHLSHLKVAYGQTLPLKDTLVLETKNYIHAFQLKDLKEGTNYYYHVLAEDESGQTISSGTLTFRTPLSDQPVTSFCVIGDTESRPFVNFQLGELMWEERPEFILHLGDITDGGQEDHKFEWNHEFFTGITPLASRIPFFPVPGNGEDDLFWYKKYHHLPTPEDYYQFKYGPVQFFMVNSNDPENLKEGSVQYRWLENELQNSRKDWKMVCHHHCPVSSDENDYGDTWKGEVSTQGDPRFKDVIKLYEKYQVDVVFYGHVHAYERSLPLLEGNFNEANGVYYIQSGGGGGNLEDFAPTHQSFSSKTQRGHHFLKIDVHPGRLDLKMFDLEGRLKDVFWVEK